ncbi:MAG: aldo/keto reductase [Magnetococcales bacterium]|nr:aldo/keto reductase [Magnetococcales bacterium]
MTPDVSIASAHGIAMPRILYGTAWKRERTAALVEQAVALGFRGIDTACQPKHYDEAGVGSGVAAALQRGVARADLYLQSKFTPLNGQDPQRIPYDPKATLREQVTQSLHRSLHNLQTNYLDGLLLHSPMATPAQTMEVWQAMEQLCHEGLVKQLGISNCYDLEMLAYLHHAATVKPVILQNRFYAATRYDREIRAFCREQQILYQSFWTLSANPAILAHATLHGLVQKYQRTAAQLFFRYLSQMGIVPLTGTTSALHMRESLAIFEFELTEAECEAVGALL